MLQRLLEHARRHAGPWAPRAGETHEAWPGVVAALGALLILSVGAQAHSQARVAKPAAVKRVLAVSGGDLSEQGLSALAEGMDPAMLALARRIAPAPEISFTEKAALGVDPTEAPAPMGWREMSPELARMWNASMPVSAEPNPAARPFFLKAGDVLDAGRALDCLAAAVWYEAAHEPLEGQQAVAQVVLNRLRHPAYPKTVCGVVFQGAQRTTGCQFTFTCDGSLNRTPPALGWRRARRVAAAALDGFVLAKVGSATHYHADYVAPYWAPSLTKVAQIGAHVFYRWNGGAGRPGAFVGTWAGLEPALYPISTVVEVPAVDAAPLEIVPATETVSDFGPAHEAAVGDAVPAEPAAAPAVPAPVTATVAGVQIDPTSAPETQARRRDPSWSRLPVRTDW